jgi:putative nucleotidyltransferase with HDIG domain
MKGQVRAYVGMVTICAVLGGLYFASVGDPMLLASAQAALCFAFLAILAQVLPYKPDAHTTTSVVFVPYLATVLLAPTWVAISAIAIAATIAELVARRAPVKALFNISQYVLADLAAIAVYRGLGGTSLLGHAEFRWAAYVLAYGSFTILNGLLVCLAVAIAEQRRFFPMLVSHARSAVAYDTLSIPLPYLFAIVYVHYGAMGSMALGLPLLAARQLYKTNWQLEKANQELLQLMVAAIEARDPYTSGHSRRVARNAKVIARALGLSSRDIARVGIAALLHDVGKIHEVFAPILRKPGKLTSDERLTMQSHPIKSAELVQNVSHLQDVVIAIRNHHENWDGSGYPDGLRGEEIPLWSRVIMIADTIDAMTTDRPYRAALTEPDVRAEMIKLRAKQFDPAMCDRLLSSPLYASLFERQVTGASDIQAWRRKKLPLRVAIKA